MAMGICGGRWLLGVVASIATSAIAVGMAHCESHPDKIKGRIPTPIGPIEGEATWKREGPEGPLPSGWTPDGMSNLCFDHKGNTYCVNLCIATQPGTDCVYIKQGNCDEGSGWIKYCPTEVSGNANLLAGPDCTTTTASVSYDLLTGLTDVDYTVQCTNWVDENLVDVYIEHPSDPGTFLDSHTFRIVYGDYMPAGSRVQFSGDPEETAWNTRLLRADRVEFETTTGDDVVSVILDAGSDAPPFAVTVVNGQIVDVRAIYDPR